jgi:hypothetical protein
MVQARAGQETDVPEPEVVVPGSNLVKLISRSLIFVALLAGIFGAVSAQADEVNQYVPSFANLLADSGQVGTDGCLVRFDDVISGRCTYGDPSSKKKVVVFGDSHALHWTPALLRIAERRGWRLVALLKANCTSALVNTKPACNEWRRNSLERIRRLKPSLVILGTNTSFNVRVADGSGGTLSRSESSRALESGMVTTMRRMLRLNAKVTLIRDLLVPPFDPSACVQLNPESPELCAFDAVRPYWMSFDYKAARRVSRVQIVDPLTRVCPGGICQATSGRILMYRDASHFSATYAATLSGWFGRRLQKP